MGSWQDKLRLLTLGTLSDVRSPLSGVLARLAVSKVDPRATPDANMLAVPLFVRDTIRYAREVPESFAGLEALYQLGAGDCDCMSRAAAAMLIRLGYRVRWALGWEGAHPTHIWIQAWSDDARQWLDLDPSSWKVEPGQDPQTVRRFDRVTLHNL